jgi:hypothetical protein
MLLSWYDLPCLVWYTPKGGPEPTISDKNKTLIFPWENLDTGNYSLWTISPTLNLTIADENNLRKECSFKVSKQHSTE